MELNFGLTTSAKAASSNKSVETVGSLASKSVETVGSLACVTPDETGAIDAFGSKDIFGTVDYSNMNNADFSGDATSDSATGAGFSNAASTVGGEAGASASAGGESAGASCGGGSFTSVC